MHQISDQPPDEFIFGLSAAMQHFRETVLRVAAVPVPVLILGESGAGKEVLAKFIHTNSPQHPGPFVKVNCPAIPATLVESELFGYEKGAFTGAYESKPGLIEASQGGTLFLDEIAELPTSLQAKLLHLLQDGKFMRVGGQQELSANVRLLCATNRRLSEEIPAGAFRQDLFYRINVISLEIPPLRERREDIAGLVNYFLGRYQREYRSEPRNVSPNLMQLLVQHSWPGNIRELENQIKRYVILGSEEAIATDLLGRSAKVAANATLSLKTLTRAAVRDLERKIILDVLYANNWNRKEAARILQISYRALFYKIKDSNLPQKRLAPARPQQTRTRQKGNL